MSAEVETESDWYNGLVIDTGNVVCSNKLSRILDVDDSSTRLQSLDPVNTLPSPVAPTNDIPAPRRAEPYITLHVLVSPTFATSVRHHRN